MQISFSVCGTGRRSGEHIVSFVTDILWHCGALAPLKPLAHIEPSKENSRRKQVDAHHNEALQVSNMKDCGYRWVCNISPKRVPSTMKGHTKCSDTCSDENCEIKTYHFYLLLGSGV